MDRIFSDAHASVKIGDKPKIFTDEKGRAAGIFIDLLNEIAKKEGWTLVYFPCEWVECLSALEDGRIDLMPDVAYSQERSEKFDFHKTPVADSWSQMYSNPGVPISRLSDLDGRRVALLLGSIQEKVLQQTMMGFGFNVTIVPVSSFEEGFKLVSKGSADATITNHFNGDFFYQKYDLAKTTIVFNVVSLYYVTAKGRNPELLKKIDRNLNRWMKEPGSPYYRTLSRWMEKPPYKVLPRYFLWVFSAIAGLLILAAGMIVLLHQQVAARTRHLVAVNEELKRHRENLEELVNERTGELLKTQEQLIQAQKMEAVGQLAGGISHDFNNMLAIILGTSELILRNMKSDDPNHEKLTRVIKTGNRAKDITGRLLTFARKEKLEITNCPIRNILLDVVEMLKSSITKKIDISTTIADDTIVIRGDVNQLGQALLNICLNSCEAMKEVGTLKIEVTPVTLDENFCRSQENLQPGGYCLVKIMDDGCGIPANIVNRIFDPFFTTRAKGEGTGLGLSVTQGIIKMHNGLIEVESEPEKGTTVKVYLPIAKDTPAGAEKESINDSQNGKNETILIVDDEKDFTDMLSDFLCEEGYNPLAANSGKEALDIFGDNHYNIKLVLLDIMMPGMDGSEVFTALRTIRQDVKVVLCSGFSVEGKAREILNQGAYAFIQKPYDIQHFLKTISGALMK